MRTIWLNVSVATNLVLAGFLTWTAYPLKNREAPTPATTLESKRSSSVESSAPVVTSDNLTADEAEPGFVHWSQLESPDYRLYAANLRGIGCPPETIDDIISADIDALYRLKVKALADTVQPRFWELLADKKSFERLVEEKYGALQALEKEREGVLEEVLGIGHKKHNAWEHFRELATTRERRQFLDFLPPEKVEAMLALDQTFAERGSHLDDVRLPLTDQERQTALQACQADEAEARAQVLSRAERDEYQLRSSPAAQVRLEMSGFSATEDEVKTVVRIRQATAAETARTTTGARRAELQASENEKLKSYFGETRFAEYQRCRDSTFQQLRQLSEVCELPTQVAVNVYEARLAADEQAAQLRKNRALSEEQRAQALRAVAAETERWMNETLGERAFQIYRSRAGGWLESLAVTPK